MSETSGPTRLAFEFELLDLLTSTPMNMAKKRASADNIPIPWESIFFI
jgi:hypothetical protein